jgi:membrane-bound ClpP family serine protease
MSNSPNGFGIAKENYKILLVGLALIVLGYILMIGGGSDDPNVFNPEIFSTQRITIAPITCLAGFVVVIVAIMRRPKSKDEVSK